MIEEILLGEGGALRKNTITLRNVLRKSYIPRNRYSRSNKFFPKLLLLLATRKWYPEPPMERVLAKVQS
jgi:hypothetical protein